MLSNHFDTFTKDTLDNYLKELAKEFRRLNGKYTPAEIILIGGASVLVNYGFREMTTDIDALIQASSAMKDAIRIVGDKFNLPNGWLNSDFTKTLSYSPKLVEYSKYYKTFSKMLTIRTISAEYLIAMKLCSGRKYKNDLSDIIGILAEHEQRNDSITYDQIDLAVCNLYGSWERIPFDSINFINNAYKNSSFQELYKEIQQEESTNKIALIEFETDYPNVVNQANINDILIHLKSKKTSKK